jgi:hypothetical protein
MPRFARQLLIAWVVALHAAVMLCGPCLHGLPGWDHGSNLGCAAEHHRARDADKSGFVTPDHCAVCQLFSLGQLPTDFTRVSSAGLAGPLRPEKPSEPFTPTLHRSTSPRAPPFAPSLRPALIASR